MRRVAAVCSVLFDALLFVASFAGRNEERRSVFIRVRTWHVEGQSVERSSVQSHATRRSSRSLPPCSPSLSLEDSTCLESLLSPEKGLQKDTRVSSPCVLKKRPNPNSTPSRNAKGNRNHTNKGRTNVETKLQTRTEAKDEDTQNIDKGKPRRSIQPPLPPFSPPRSLCSLPSPLSPRSLLPAPDSPRSSSALVV